MRSGRVTLLVFGVCVLLVVEALGWLTWQALRYERREAEARAESAFQDRVRLALWRLDSLLIPILRQEDSRPYFHYRSFYAEAQAYNAMYQPLEPDAVLVPSPLLTRPDELVLLHFEVGSDGNVTSPQAPEGNMRDQAEAHYVSSERVIAAEARLSELRSIVSASLLELTPEPVLALEPLVRGGAEEGSPEEQDAQQELDARDADYATRRQLAQRGTPELKIEKEAGEALVSSGDRAGAEAGEALVSSGDRAGAEAGLGAALREPGRFNELADRLSAPPVRTEPMRATWLTGEAGIRRELMLIRQVRVGSRKMVQGVWLDWPALRARMRSLVEDLLPEAALVPVLPSSPVVESSARLLASAPIVLLPGDAPRVSLPTVTPLRATLGVTWLAVLAAIAAIGFVLRASLKLSARRARFVSAVTHELRTPLTTFRLYTQMLADGMVPDEAARREYLGTLKRESQRLSQIVENILEYARLGRRQRKGRKARPVRELLDGILPPLAQRAGSGGMRLVAEHGPSLETTETTLDEGAIERILYNLVDNACKYAADARDRRIHLRAGIEGGKLVCTVRDHGPGIPREERRRLFEAFRRGRAHRDGTLPGLGLGLALAHGLATELGGRLRIVEPGDGKGTIFRLEAPLG